MYCSIHGGVGRREYSRGSVNVPMPVLLPVIGRTS
jgi:hypothetical protein